MVAMKKSCGNDDGPCQGLRQDLWQIGGNGPVQATIVASPSDRLVAQGCWSIQVSCILGSFKCTPVTPVFRLVTPANGRFILETE